MPDPANGKVYRVQVGSYTSIPLAKDAFDLLAIVGFSPAFERFEKYYRVVIPGIRSQDMPEVARRIGLVGFKEALIREEF
jgi:hypothetical protein